MPKDSCQKVFAKGWLIDLFAKGKARIFPVVSAQQGNLEAVVLWKEIWENRKDPEEGQDLSEYTGPWQRRQMMNKGPSMTVKW